MRLRKFINNIFHGRSADYLFGSRDFGWSGFDVVRYHSREAISSPFQYVITLARDADAEKVDLESLLDAVCEQYAKGPVGIFHGARRDDPHGHLFAVAIGDIPQRRRIVEGSRPDLVDGEPDTQPRRTEVDDAPRSVRPLLILEPTL